MAKHGTEQGYGSDPVWPIRVLSVSPVEDDHVRLKDLLIHGKWARQFNFNWLMNAALTLEAAVSALKERTVSIVVCESELRPGSWKDLLDHIWAHPDSPLLIVTSQHADEYLWAEALNCGAYDVLRKPFDTLELSRVLTSASFQWRDRLKRR